MKISLSAHPLLGAHTRIRSQHEQVNKKLTALRAQLKAVKEKEAAFKIVVVTKIKALRIKVEKYENQLETSTKKIQTANLRALIKGVRIQIKKLQQPHTSMVPQLEKEVGKLVEQKEGLRHDHSASKALLQLYAIRKWSD